MPTFHGADRLPSILFSNLDKLRLKIDTAYTLRFQSIEHYNLFKAQLGRSLLFRQGHRNHSSTFEVRTNHNLGRRWLFGGSLQFKPTNTHADNSFTGKLDLELNPSRLINHIYAEIGNSINAENQTQAFMDYLREGNPNSTLEYSTRSPILGLDRNDNLIPATAYRHMRPTLDIFDIYLDKVLQLIRQQIEQTIAAAVGASNCALEEPLENWSFPCAEIYWEYSVSNAISFVNGLRSLIIPMFSNSEIAYYLLTEDLRAGQSGIAWHVDSNSPSLKVRLTQDIDLTIYAKTHDRVRFEIGYNKNVRTLIGRISASSFPTSARGSRELLDRENY